MISPSYAFKNMQRITFAVFLLLLLGAGCVFNQPESSTSTETGDPRDAIPGVIDPEDVPTESDVDVSKPEPVELDILPAASPLCTSKPTMTETGSEEYPIDTRYEGLYFLGQLFTAARCGERRVNDLWGVRDGMYELGSSITLTEPPDEEMTKTLRWIGFTCDEGIGDGVCTRWELINHVPYQNLLYLEPFHGRLAADDCRNCG